MSVVLGSPFTCTSGAGGTVLSVLSAAGCGEDTEDDAFEFEAADELAATGIYIPKE